ncbi:MAG: hypothetical protein H0U18_16195 [Pyrinomonadaceae bacterium]|nr:hypothetical protein [Pyrinomonadaceae bacterium]
MEARREGDGEKERLGVRSSKSEEFRRPDSNPRRLGGLDTKNLDLFWMHTRAFARGRDERKTFSAWASINRRVG